MSPKARVLWLCALVVLPADQLSKAWIVAKLAYGDQIAVIEGFFYLTHVRNSGAAFGLFSEAPLFWRQLLFVAVSLLAAAVIFSFYRGLAPRERAVPFALGLVLGGAAGNFLDRIFRGEVVDFLHFRFSSGYAWPDFNVADAFIVIGVGVLVVDLLASEGRSRAGPSQRRREG
jgi:signal peptidase II